MIFNSLDYLLFLPIVVLLYYVFPVKFRWVLLLVASCYFYMSFVPVYLLILAFTIVIDYFAGIYIERAEGVRRKRLLQLSLFANIGVLCVFKYYNFFIDNYIELMAQLQVTVEPPPHLSILLPIGLSFHTFQAMSYTLEVYKGKYPAERHFGRYALYVMFFPQLVAGPIERPKALLPQFHFNYKWEWTNCVTGLRLILLGLFKKVVIADQLSVMVSYVYDNPAQAESPSIYIAMVFFAFQVYCDFSGYSDMAQGSARLLGVHLIDNFKLPFFSNSYTSFWSNWHVSLMNWFRDYIMFPMVKNQYKWQYVFLLVFLISGFWHGANWTFIFWGVYNGLLVIYSKSTGKWRSAWLDRMGFKSFVNTRHVIQSLIVFHLFAFGGLLFRAQNIHDSWILLQHTFADTGMYIQQIIDDVNNVREDLLYLGKEPVSFYLIVGFVILLMVFEWFLRNKTLDQLLDSIKLPVRYALYLFVMFSIILMSNTSDITFVYFQF